MKILFKNNTKYTKQNYNAFIEFHRNKYGKKALLKIGVLVLCILYIIIFNVIHKNWKVIIGFLTVGIILYLLNHLKIQKQSTSNKKIVNQQKTFTFYFYEKHIKIKCGRKFDRLKYFEIHRVFETPTHFFLYTDEEHSLIISKEGFEIGTSEDFTNFIKKKCLLKYKKEK